jgi:rhodanese-related sulfurtransferase
MVMATDFLTQTLFVSLLLLKSIAAPIVIYCGSGKRASKAEEVLKSNGYETVLNAGGFTDLDYLKEA